MTFLSGLKFSEAALYSALSVVFFGPGCGPGLHRASLWKLGCDFVLFKAHFLVSSEKIPLRRIGNICKGHREG